MLGSAKHVLDRPAPSGRLAAEREQTALADDRIGPQAAVVAHETVLADDGLRQNPAGQRQRIHGDIDATLSVSRALQTLEECRVLLPGFLRLVPAQHRSTFSRPGDPELVRNGGVPIQ